MLGIDVIVVDWLMDLFGIGGVDGVFCFVEGEVGGFEC